MFRAVFSFFLFILIWPGAASAADYKPGSIGYLYGNCRAALRDSASFKDIYITNCGGFLEGYVAGLLVTARMKIPEPVEQDPCYADKARAYEQINARFCPALPLYDQEKVKPRAALEAAAGMMERWVSYLGEKNLSESAARNIADILMPGPFCEYLHEDAASATLPEINSGLYEIGWRDVWEFLRKVKITDKKRQCEGDLDYAGGDSQKFLTTHCGAQIAGFIGGLQATPSLKNFEPENPQCGKSINRLLRNLDVEQSMCVNADYNPVHVAEIFVGRLEVGDITQSRGFSPDAMLGNSIGYQTIYKGFLCAEGALADQP